MSKRGKFRVNHQKSKAKYIVTLEDEYQRLQTILESGNLTEIRAYKKRTEELLAYNYKYFTELAFQRSQNKSEITQALLLSTSKDLDINGWHRAVKLIYSNHPLCAIGSMKDPGGRFNIGDIDSARYPIFPALYIAENQQTAIAELFAQDFDIEAGINITHFEYALSKNQSFAVASVSAHIPTYFDLTDEKKLKNFLNVIKDFKISQELIDEARELQLAPPAAATAISQLISTLLLPDWRAKATFFDVPENCQIFGQLLLEAGIDGVLYPSKMNTGNNFAIFTTNLANSDAWIELDSVPHRLTPKRLDKSNFRTAEMTFEEIEKIAQVTN